MENKFYSVEHVQQESLPESEQQTHSLIQRDYEHGKGSYFFCAKCDKSYLSVEDYIQCHQIIAEVEEDSINDLIEYDASEGGGISEGDHHNPSNEEFIKIEADTNKYFCYDCRTVFKELEEAEQHDCPQIELKVTPDDEVAASYESNADTLIEFTCAFCEIKFEDFAKLEEHQINCIKYERQKVRPNNSANAHKSEDKPGTSCQICNIEFLTNKRLKLHMKIHAEQPQRSIQEVLPDKAKKEYSRLDHFFCEICNKSFDQNLLEIHKNMHQEATSYLCKLCNRQFENAESYDVHQQRHKGKVSNASATSIKTGPTEAMLRNAKNGIRSIHVDNAKQTYPCQYCGHVFWRPFEKTRHERVHTGERPYACEICGKKFRVPYSLTLHLRTHTDVRPFVCPTCNKRFKSQSVYTHHLRTHLNERPYSCDTCPKTFRTSVQLNAHKDSHTKPFNCPTCNRPFASMHAVKSHMKSQHKNETNKTSTRHSCNICGAIYARTVFLRAHLKERHGVELPMTASKAEPYDNDDDEIVAEAESASDSGNDNVAALLISAAADAEARQQEEHNSTKTSNFSLCDNNSDDEAVLAMGQDYLRNELALDNFSTEETVVTGF